MNIKYLILFVYVFFLSFNTHAQDEHVDSLIAIIETLKNDSTKVNALNELSYSIWDTKPDLSIMYAIEAMELAEEIEFKKGIAFALKNIGIAYFAKSDYISVLERISELKLCFSA